MKTEQALDEIDRNSEATFANVNPHWWIGRSRNGTYWCDYSYCGDPDCSCYQHDPDQTREDILERFPDDNWQI